MHHSCDTQTDASVPVENVETLIIGGGQAGLVMSEQLSKRGLPHLILERHRIAERWRSERWDGLHANGPAWHDRLSLFPIAGVDPDGFATRNQMVDYFVAYAERIAAPIRSGIEVTALHANADGTGFRAETSNGVIAATNVIAATGPFQRPVIPARRAAGRWNPAASLERIPQSRPTAGGSGTGGRSRLVRDADS